MPGPLHARTHPSFVSGQEASTEKHGPRVQISHEDEDALADIHRTLTEGSLSGVHLNYPEPHSSFDKFLEEQVRGGKKRSNLGVCFQSVSTWGEGDGHTRIKTLGMALWRTFTLQDIYEWTIQPWLSSKKPQQGRPIIRDFSGVVESGEMMLVLGCPGAGCSTFLRTVAGHHSSFLRVTGSIEYSGLSPDEVRKHYRSVVAYVPEDDVHFPTLNVRQTLEFALRSKTPKRFQDRIPKYLEIYGRVFGMTHTMNTLVGNEYIRGVSGGERKRISIIESLATDSSVTCWDNSTRGLDASSALDYVRSLRIMTDTCGKATLLTLYQASDAIYELVDKGPAGEAKRYFEDLGYESAEMQTISDFLTSITVPERRRFRAGWEDRAPKGAIELETAFRQSAAFKNLETSVEKYDDQRNSDKPNGACTSDSESNSVDDFKRTMQSEKSRFVSSKSPYTISLFRQIVLCAQRQMWQLRGHMGPLYIKLISAVVYGLLIGSMFYDQPQTTDGMYSRGGVLFYSSILLAWLQMSELEEAMQGRDIISRQKKFAFVRPSAVCMARVAQDMVVTALLTLLYLIVMYFLSGLRSDAGPFFIDFLFIYMCTICLTAQFRVLAALSNNFEVALRYCGVSVLFCVVFGGYVLSLDKMIQDVPWVGWIAYTTPALYTYESVMAAEFHNVNFTCATGSIIPAGSNYTDVAYQTCAYAGSQIGSTVINGDDYLAAQFGFYYSHVWRNFGILCLFTVAFIGLTCWLSEVMEWELTGAGPIQYKSNCHLLKRKHGTCSDEENSPVPVDPRSPRAESSFGPSGQSLSGTDSTFTWSDLGLDVQVGKETRKLLDNVCGYCKPGSLTALVGASGAGKSTLLTALTQRQSAGTLTGSMYVDSEPINKSFNRQIGYCQQMDIHDESSTIRAAFEFSALLRQRHETPINEKLAYVETVLHTLDLIELQNAMIGSLDIEKRKRVTIGVELCARPRLLLFLDEPTSGLDSQGATNIVALLRRLANQGLAILCTIHQANQQQFEEFDRVLALSPGGSTYYFGPVGQSGKAIFDYFKKNGHCPQMVTNAADFLIEVVVGGTKVDSESQVNWASIWRDSEEAEHIIKEISAIRAHHDKSRGNLATPSLPPLHQQVMLLTQRTCRQFWRTAEYPYSRVYASFLHALVNGLTYLQIGNSKTDLQSKAFSAFLVLMLVPEFINAISMRFILNRDIWLAREGPSGVYSWVAFSTAQIITEIPYAIVSGVIFYVMYYFMVGLPLGFAAGYSFLMFFLFFLFATSWGQWIAALSADSMVAATLMPFFIIMCELFNGILRPHEQMPAFWKYTMYYITPFTYWIGGVLTSVLRGTPVVCNESELTLFESPPHMTCGDYASPWLTSTGVGYLSNPESSGICGYCEYSYGDDYLSGIGLDDSVIWPYFGIFLAFTIANYLMVYLLVYLRSVAKWRSK
ncbi:uncharacterized protein N7477_001168 [Penicillium maclennaniae]|uniref:uncharacterized protein n=1 Tax=Penicillium maclennaniae TaxID=1343394 RepID=UPI002542073A|nr:uncharacterized protein N7477_001168 [Penicillium maclennaniae]KAJ5684823.1 hypothetical protein N7477_001168 [Penicillium maclennaniae]